MKSLIINAKSSDYKIKKINSFSILKHSLNEHLKDKTYKQDPLSEFNPLIISAGPFTGLSIPGAHRAIISGRSPLTKGFFFSTIGGLGEELYRTSVDSIKVTNRAVKPSIILVKHQKGELIVRLEPINNLKEAYGKHGVFSLQEWLIKEFGEFFKGLRYRSIVAGPAGFNTSLGGLSSVVVKGDELDYGSEGFAGRGGYGSVLAQGHNIAGLMIGGDFKKEVIPAINKIITNQYQEDSVSKVAMNHTSKYRGKGTLLSNFESSRNDTLMFNWNNMYWPKSKRFKFYDKLIKDSFLEEFTSEELTSKTCGEACPALCKKVQGGHVKDYEPYSSCGPNLGVFSQEAAELIVTRVDELGFDAISFGNLASTVFEAISKGYIKPGLVGLKQKPVFNVNEFKTSDSLINARLAVKLAEFMCSEKTILDKGIRSFVNEFNIPNGVFFCFGSEGVMSPNEYLRPGFITPLPIIGKFTTYYGQEFVEPFELGKLSAERLIKELFNEDLGFCRFHRGWAENVIPLMINKLINQEEFDYEVHIKGLINDLILYNRLSDSLPQKWCGKTKDLLYHHLLVSADAFGESKIISKWLSKFKQDPDKALSDYWRELVKGVASVLGVEYENAMG